MDHKAFNQEWSKGDHGKDSGWQTHPYPLIEGISGLTSSKKKSKRIKISGI